jgi:RNA-directed DNA polymerase
MRQKNQVELNLGTGAEGEARSTAAREPEASTAKACPEHPAVAGPLMEDVVERENLKTALAQVKRNKGAAGLRGADIRQRTQSSALDLGRAPGVLSFVVRHRICGR